jgi:uncharacterized protein (TIGR03382 family)
MSCARAVLGVLAAVAWIVACAPSYSERASAAAELDAPAKVHAIAEAAHHGVSPPSARPVRHGLPPRRSPSRRLTRRVYGYLPYWVSDWQHVRFDLLSTLAYFASPIDERGVITASHGWGGAGVRQIVEAAKRAGARVVTTITNFDDAAIGRLLGSAENRDRAIQNIIAEVRRGDGEGVNIDFEFVPVAHKASFVTFMRDLTLRMHAAIPDSEVTLAAPSVDWSGAYDYDQLAIHTDGLMIMAYGYHWTGGSPGPLSPIRADAPWTGRSLTWTIDDYERFGGRENRDKFILGLPFYGNDWPTTSNQVPGTARGRGSAIVYRAAALAAARHGRRWDTASGGTPYYVFQDDGGWHQVWYDDAESLGLKLDLIERRDWGGLGIWALGYDGDRPELFAVIEEKLSVPIVPPGDGGVRDGGIMDAGVADAGLIADAGVSGDGGGPIEPIEDAGVSVGGTEGGASEPPAVSSGGCETAAGGGASMAFFAAVCAWIARRRKNQIL